MSSVSRPLSPTNTATCSRLISRPTISPQETVIAVIGHVFRYNQPRTWLIALGLDRESPNGKAKLSATNASSVLLNEIYKTG